MSSLGPSLQGQCGRDGVLSQADVVRAPVGVVDGRLVRLCERPLVPDLLLGHVPPEDGLHPAAGRDLHRRAERDVNREPGEHADRFGPRLDGDVHRLDAVCVERRVEVPDEAVQLASKRHVELQPCQARVVDGGNLGRRSAGGWVGEGEALLGGAHAVGVVHLDHIVRLEVCEVLEVLDFVPQACGGDGRHEGRVVLRDGRAAWLQVALRPIQALRGELVVAP
mmetsp:Transcript_17380/g.56872  ORF Transcript_17380/g.56872 Transcript_17380/m.56872 type:complete len:223 (+) Transcript_17380:608-1276(+)